MGKKNPYPGREMVACPNCNMQMFLPPKPKDEEIPIQPETMSLLEMCLYVSANYKMKRYEHGDDGDKEIVNCKFQIFNGEPQVMFYYGKTRYIFKFEERKQQNRQAALNNITGRKGIESLPMSFLKSWFLDSEIQQRRLSLLGKGR